MMAQYGMRDGRIVDTDKAQHHWLEQTVDYISLATDSPVEHETLYLSSNGEYYVVWQTDSGEPPAHATWLEPAKAAAWLLRMGHPLPGDLEIEVDKISE